MKLLVSSQFIKLGNNSQILKDVGKNELQIIYQQLELQSKANYYFEAEDYSMRFFGINKGAIVFCNPNQKPAMGNIIVCRLNGEWLIRKYMLHNGQAYLFINEDSANAIATAGRDFEVIGVVNWTVNKMVG